MKKLLLFVFTALFLVTNANSLIVENPYANSFKKAYALYPSVPKGVLEAVAWTQTRFTHLSHEENSCIGLPQAFSVMGLTEDGKDYFRSNLSFVAQLSGFSEKDIKQNAETSIIAYAAAFNKLQSLHANFSSNPADYKKILVELS